MNRFPIENIDKVNSSVQSDKLAVSRNIKLTGDASGTTSFDGASEASISVTIADDSHNHVISNIDNLQSTIDNINIALATKGVKLTVSGKTIKLLDANDNELSSITTQDTNTTYDVATTIANGLMSSTDKVNLNSAIKSITRSGTTFTFTRVDGSTGTFTQQDNSTNYTAGTGISLNSNKISLATVVTAGNAGPTANASPAHGGTFTVPYITYDAYGRVTGRTNRTITLPATPTTITGNAGSATKLATARNIKVTVNSKEGTTTSSTSSNCSFNGTGAITMIVDSYYVDTWDCSANCCGGDGGSN